MSRHRGIVDAILLQAGWWIAVLGAAKGLPWAGPLGVAAMVAIHCALRTPEERGTLLRFGLVLAILGTGLDTFLSRIGVLGFPDPPVPGLAPPWISALWFQFAVAPELLSSLGSRRGLAALLGAIGGPLAYAGGARLGAATLGPGVGEMPALLTLGAVWAVVLPSLLSAGSPRSAARPEVRPA